MYQPDGSSFMARLKGDEFSKVLTTEDGCAVIKCEDGFYRLATFKADGGRVSSGFKPGDKAPDTVLRASRMIPWNTLRDKTSGIRRERRESIRFKPATRADIPVKKH